MAMYDDMANSHPSLKRGMVWCRTCGRSKRVDSAVALQNGWPKCCGYTMTIDSPEEQNQCDGCKQGLRVINGLHRTDDDKAFMACTAHLYR